MNIEDLIGKTIKEAYRLKARDHSDIAWLRLVFTDGTECHVQSSYGSYSCDESALEEYPCIITVTKVFDTVKDFFGSPVELERHNENLV